MNTSKNKTIASTLALLLMISLVITLFSLLTFANAADKTGYEVKSYPFVEAVPNPVGVKQRTLINFGLLNYLNTDGDGWNVTLTITKPDGTTETVGPLMTWSTGTVGHSFIPEVNGTYKLQCHFDACWYNYTGFDYSTFTFKQYSQWMLSSESEVYELIVQDDPVPYYPVNPLPSEYWSRPIDSQLREWYSISGSWLASPLNLYAPYNDAPESAHILWAKPIGDSMGGLAGGDTGEHGYGNGDAYEGKWVGSVIISGILYYNRYASPILATSPQQEVVAVDLHTGEELWTRSFQLGNGRIATGQILYWDCLNYRGAFSYIWIVQSGSWWETNVKQTWYALDALTGDLKYNMTDVPSGTNYFGPNGEILKYSISNGRLLQWNSSYVVTKGTTGMSESWGSQTLGVKLNATARGYDLNVSIPSTLPSTSILQVFPGDRVIGGNASIGKATGNGVTLWGLSLKKGSEGTLLFSNTWAAPTEWKDLTATQSGFCTYSQENMVAIYWAKENRVNYAFSLENGQKLWETKPQIYSDAWTDSPSYERVVAYDRLYTASCGGIVYCYDINNGKLLWNYTADDPYQESYIGNNWWLIVTFVSDGKIYFGHMEHSALDPKPRGAPFFCLNATDGSLIWEIDGAFRQTRWGGRAIIGDSIIATMDTYDQRVYAIGKGPSAMTVTAPDTAVPFKTPVILKGTITDVSPGTKDDAITFRFPNGVPAVSDTSQSDWMLYVYKQFAQPSDAVGVPISLDAMDPNNNYVHIGDTVSDTAGTFSYMWTPEIPGKYTVYATFAGSASYYSSYAQTAMGVQEAPASTPQPTTAPVSITEQYFVPAITGIIVAIIAVGIVLALLVRRRP